MSTRWTVAGAPATSPKALRGQPQGQRPGSIAPKSATTGPADEGVVWLIALLASVFRSHRPPRSNQNPTRKRVRGCLSLAGASGFERPAGTDAPSDGLGPALAGADADAVLQRQDEDLAVADAALGAGAPGLHDGVDRRLHEVLVDGDLQLDLAEEVHGQLVAAVDLGVPLLAAEALHVHDGQAEDLDLVERFLDRFQLRRLDDGEDEFHGSGAVRDPWGDLLA